MSNQPYGFEIIYPEVTNGLVTDVFIAQAFDPTLKGDHPELKKFKALWDTGSTNSGISSQIVKECELKPIGMVNVHSSGGSQIRPVYLINIGLPNKIGLSNMRVTESTLDGNIDVLIGMDIISQGDLSIFNRQGKTTFSFQMSSLNQNQS